MAKKPNKEIRVGDLVRVVRGDNSLSDQRYKVEWLGRKDGLNCACKISQWPPCGPNPAWEMFDTSLLAVDNSGPKLLAQRFPKIF